MPSPAASPIAEFLAQREALTGEARRHFIHLLAEEYNYRSQASRPALWLFAAVAAGFVGLGLDVWMNRGALPGWLWFSWPALSACGASLSLTKRLHEDAGPRHRELHWKVYCLLVRPIILAERPGLLDCNLPVYLAPLSILADTPLRSVRSLMSGRGEQFWRAAFTGLWSGMAGLLLIRSQSVESPYSLLLPLGGMLAGPVFWGIGQWIALKSIARDPRLSR